MLITPSYIPSDKCVKIERKPQFATAYPSNIVSFEIEISSSDIKTVQSNTLTIQGPKASTTNSASFSIKTDTETLPFNCSSATDCGTYKVYCKVDKEYASCNEIVRVNLFACPPIISCNTCPGNTAKICANACPSSCPAITQCASGDTLICPSSCPPIDCVATANACPTKCKVCSTGTPMCLKECCTTTSSETYMSKCDSAQNSQTPGYFELLGSTLKINHKLIPGKTVSIELGGRENDSKIQLGVPLGSAGRPLFPTPEGATDFRSTYHAKMGGQGPIIIHAANSPTQTTYQLSDNHLKNVTAHCHQADDADGSCITYFKCHDSFDGSWKEVCCDTIIKTICVK